MTELNGHLDRLETTGLIRVAQLAPEIEYLFRHALVQDAAYSSLLKQDRRTLHRAVAEAIEKAYPDRAEEFAAMLALHFAQAEDDERALHYFTLAGDSAIARYANAEAIQHLTSAIEIEKRSPSGGDLDHLFLQRGHAYEFLGNYEAALANYVELQYLTVERQDKAGELTSLMAQATIRATTTSVHDPKEALRLLNSALEMSRVLGNRSAEAKTLWNLMLYHKFAGNPSEAVKNGEASLEIARELNLREQIAFTMNDLVTHGYLDAGEFEKARKLIDEVRELWKELNNLSMLADSYSSAAIVYYILGEYDNTIRVAGEARRVSESIHNLWGESYSRWIVGEVYLERGEIGTALQTMEDCITLGEQAGFIGAASGVGASLTFALGSLGMFSEALDRGGRAVAITEKMLPGWLVWPLSAVACVQVWAGDIPAAVQTANRIEQIIRTEQVMQFPFSLTSVNLALATVRLANNDPAGAHRSLDEMVAYLDRTQLRPYRADAIDLRGKVYLAEDNVEAAAAAFEEARSAAESLQSRHKLWRIYASLADLKVRAGDQAAADDLRRKSREIIEFIADHAGRKEVRDAFLNLSEVRKLHA